MVATKRRFNPNLQRVRVLLKGKATRAYVCTRCLKGGKVQKGATRSEPAARRVARLTWPLPGADYSMACSGAFSATSFRRIGPLGRGIAGGIFFATVAVAREQRGLRRRRRRQ